MREKILEMCNELCHKEIKAEDELILSGLLDSFKIMELICSLEEEFQITFLPEEIYELENFYSVNQIVNTVEGKLSYVI